jgi:hypothetical protein
LSAHAFILSFSRGRKQQYCIASTAVNRAVTPLQSTLTRAADGRCHSASRPSSITSVFVPRTSSNNLNPNSIYLILGLWRSFPPTPVPGKVGLHSHRDRKILSPSHPHARGAVPFNSRNHDLYSACDADLTEAFESGRQKSLCISCSKAHQA